MDDRVQENNLAGKQDERVRVMITAIQQWKETPPKSPDVRCISSAASASSSGAKPAPDRSRAFQRWDKNGDGVLTLEEYTAGLANKTRADVRFKNFDKDGDGKLTREEFIQP